MIILLCHVKYTLSDTCTVAQQTKKLNILLQIQLEKLNYASQNSNLKIKLQLIAFKLKLCAIFTFDAINSIKNIHQ